MASRSPAVAGAFYPRDPAILAREVADCLGPEVARRPAFGAIVPHAGYVYSGSVAGAVYARLEPAHTVILLGPNHTGRGAAASIDAHDRWETPLGSVRVDRGLADRLAELCPSLERESAAHDREHSLEVQLPFLKTWNPEVAFVPICLGAPSLALCREIGEACASVTANAASPIPVFASSDMNHYESREAGDAKNAIAFRAIQEVDPEGLFSAVIDHDISMCGFLPATALLFAARSRGIDRAEIIARADSGDRTGDTASVVGYAGIIVG
jgi:AmmeMemoRadiSam system protein B